MEILTGIKPFKGTITIPPSKSMSHRALIAAGLSKGSSHLMSALNADDIEATLDCLLALGVESQVLKSTVVDSGLDVIVEGFGGDWPSSATIKSRESGSTLRFMIPVALVSQGHRVFEGTGRLVERPIKPYIDMFEETGIEYTYDGKLPLVVSGQLESGSYKVPGNISSQFITGLLMALPILKGDSEIIVEGQLESESYVELTIDVLQAFDINIEKTETGYFIKGDQVYKSCVYEVEGDFSQAAFFIAAGLLGQDPLTLKGLSRESKQGDKAMIDIVKNMGGVVEWQGDDLLVHPSELHGTTIDLKDCPDLGPIVSVLGALSKGTTTIINAERLRIKESDRLAAMTSELKKMGAHIEETSDGMVINGVPTLMGAKVEGWNDHRIVMALTVAGIKTFNGVRIEGAEAVKKSYPGFFDDVKSLGGHVKIFSDPLVSLRNEITAIDASIVECLERRFEIIEKIAQIKEENGIEVLDAEREKELLLKLKSISKQPEMGVIEAVYERILDVSRQVQTSRMAKI